MNDARKNAVCLRVWGDNACFTRPEMKVERVSYDVMTPSAARGILEAILWKPAIRWQVTRIDVLKPIRWESVRRNEVETVVSTRNVTTAMSSGRGELGLYIEEARQQRAGLFLRDVDYLIHACFELTDKAGHEDNHIKFAQMFRRRAEKGQCFNQPYLGCREFSAAFEPVEQEEELPVPISESRDLGWMLYDLDHLKAEPRPYFFRAMMEQGTIRVPAWDSSEVMG
ncbi:type I-C CRISPR-associated protein Cas5c [Nitrosococcus wardiae]|uniref:pre-crRNA processing endonuclease n=1 Tax=Nitrosococcus wardiae TaxID=1814290 RepID=A0A4P7BYK3_9GAMM|nr:type I-C CRISPR-associated protein Cas5c [Nitrosococcus wardiae]QBQ55263.1 type I-C CRISPR-associated protein Cas5 [Nitrosococcus wardiae]